jgi:hypothetical protein
MNKILPKFSFLSKFSGKTLLLGQALLDQAVKYSTIPFTASNMIHPRVEDKFYSWTHYGIFFPLLPEPHRYLNIMIFIGTPGVLAFDHDAITQGDPRKSATFFSSTAAIEQHLLKAYIIPQETHISAQDNLIALGTEVTISGQLPNIHLKGQYYGLNFEFDLDVSNHASWFVKSPIYDHFSLLSRFKGKLDYQGQSTLAEGLCTYEYARAVGPYNLSNTLLAEQHKIPLTFFTYQIINLDKTTQLLLTKVDVLGKPAAYTLHIRHTDQSAEIYTQVEFKVISHDIDDYVAPDGHKMRLPRLFSWTAYNDDDQKILDITAEIDSPYRYGHGRGYASAYNFTGQYYDTPVDGRGYIEYIDMADQKSFDD